MLYFSQYSIGVHARLDAFVLDSLCVIPKHVQVLVCLCIGHTLCAPTERQLSCPSVCVQKKTISKAAPAACPAHWQGHLVQAVYKSWCRHGRTTGEEAPWPTAQKGCLLSENIRLCSRMYGQNLDDCTEGV